MRLVALELHDQFAAGEEHHIAPARQELDAGVRLAFVLLEDERQLGEAATLFQGAGGIGANRGCGNRARPAGRQSEPAAAK